ncbi:GPI mannosyltransferase 4-like [Portunus trituberculatus]|uniref:Mannosyltransferase n=1 Tax=Portunus trituberculatus TaxID=210409 RepID=A0A5B7D4W2_PORTR|nr:GPI mannosyltransferase 4-like [Portunus trituberculatus]MPC16064.1 GPI mannosyltransferase 4 [Portunus trituberculatus]
MECRKRQKFRAAFNKKFPKAVKPVKVKDSAILWTMLALARLYLATVQTGYIHPDEFHQSVQVMASDILNIDARKPWEFHSENPIRSVTFSAVVSLPYLVLKYLAPVVTYCFGYNLLTPSILLVTPRMFMTFLSFVADYSVYRIAQLCYLRPWSCVEVFASSYIMLVFATRTFSNTLELILMALLLWRVCESMVDSTKIIRKENILQDLYESAEAVQDKVKLVRMKTKLPPYNYVDSAIISVVVTYGTFVRPTFVVFSFVPVAYWLQRGVVTREVSFSYFNLRFLSLLPGAVATFLTCVLADSFYYGAITTTELLFWNVTARSFVVTPVNFVLYNAQGDNLAVHGLHPNYLHLLVNVPMLHGVLGLLGLWSVSKYLVALTTGAMTKKPKVFSLATMLLASFIVPVLLLSLVPHQEARFLLPTLLPLVLLHSDDVLILTGRRIKMTKHFFFLSWHVWNILCVAFFGFLHQGGVTKTLMQVHQHALQRPPHINSHVLFSAMYTPPTFLLVRRLTVTAQAEDGRHYRIEKSLFTYDTGGAREPEDLLHLAARVHRQAQLNSTREVEVLICLPASLSEGLFLATPENVTLQRLQRVRGHLTLEDPPDLSLEGVALTSSCGKVCQLVRHLDQFSIDIISVNFGQKVTPGRSAPLPGQPSSVAPQESLPEAALHNLTEDEEEEEEEDQQGDEDL